MFEYMKEELQKNLEKYSSLYDSKWEELESVNFDLERLKKYRSLKIEVLSNKIRFSLFVLPTALLLGYCFVNGFSWVPVIFSSLFLIKAVVHGNNIVSNKKTLKENYSDFLNMSKEELNQYVELLENKKCYIDNDLNHFRNFIITYNGKLNSLEEYEDISKEKFTPYYQASNEEEYHDLLMKKAILIDALDDYLEQKIEYSDIHFDNSIGESIDYTENSKKLIKKM